MRSRWFHAPRFHTVRHGEKAVSWLELFYDLVFVAAIIQLGNVLSDQITTQGTVAGPMMQFAGLFIPLWVAWTGYTFFANRFTLDDFPHRLLVFVKMIAMGVMAISATDVVIHGEHQIFAIAYCLVQSIVALMYFRANRQSDEGSNDALYWGVVFTFGAVLWLASIWIPTPWAYVVWGLGVFAVLVAPISKQSRQLAEQFPIDMEHLGERYGLLTIIVLGESFVKVLSYLSGGDTLITAPYIFKAAASLFITCSLWWIYFDDVAGAHLKKGKGNWIVWLYGHLPLALAITAVGVAVNKVVAVDFSLPPDGVYQTFLAGSLALVFFSVAIIDSVTERREAQLSDQSRISMRFASAIFVLVLGFVLGVMSAGLFIAIITAVCLGQIFFDIMMQPHTDVDEEFKAATAVSQRAQQIGGGQRRKRRRFNRSTTLTWCEAGPRFSR